LSIFTLYNSYKAHYLHSKNTSIAHGFMVDFFPFYGTMNVHFTR